MTIDAFATRGCSSVECGFRRSTTYSRAARARVYVWVGTIVIACPYRLATSLETTTHVRTFRGSTPTDGSHWIYKTSPRRTSAISRFIVVEQPELPCLEVLQHRPRVRPVGHVVGRE